MPLGGWLTHCECGKEIVLDGYHLLTCKHGGGPVWQHDSVVVRWSECPRDVGLHYKKEPRHRYTRKEERPDIVVFDSDEGQTQISTLLLPTHGAWKPFLNQLRRIVLLPSGDKSGNR